jgi:hypothetical protein
MEKLTQRWHVWFYSVLAVLLCVSGMVQIWAGADGDKEFCLYIAHQLVSGKRLYLQMFEPSPPLIFWILTIPVKVSQWLGVMDGYVLSVMGLLLCAFSVSLATALIKNHQEFSGNRHRQTLFAFLIAFIFIIWINPAYFADREHLIVVLIFPYILSKMPALDAVVMSRRLSGVIGLMAGLGYCIKPHAAIIFIFIQVMVYIRRRSYKALLSTETLVAVATGALYLLAIGIFTPEYYSVVVPMALKTYAANNRGIGVLPDIAICLFIVAVTLCDFRLKYSTPYRRDIYYFFGVGGACAGYILLNNGWAYTFYPLTSIIMLITAWVYCEHAWLLSSGAYPEKQKQFTFGRRACALNMAANTAIMFIIYGLVFFTTQPKAEGGQYTREAIIKEIATQKADDFGTISMNFSIWPSVAKVSGANQSTRFSNLWMLNAFMFNNEEFLSKNLWVIDWIGQAYAQDLSTSWPKVVFVENGILNHMGGKDSNLLTILSGSKAFSDVWKNYKKTETIITYENYSNTPVDKQRGALYEMYVKAN